MVMSTQHGQNLQHFTGDGDMKYYRLGQPKQTDMKMAENQKRRSEFLNALQRTKTDGNS